MAAPKGVFDFGFAVSPDVSCVVAASDALHIKEIRLFQVAFTWWFGRDASDTDVEKPFMRYLTTERAPVWVRQFAREVLARKNEGRLDPHDYGLPPIVDSELDPHLQTVLRFLLYAAWGVMIGVLFFGIG